MGIDLKAGGRRTGHKSSMKVVKTKNPYNRLLIKLYKFLSRRTESKFCATVLKRLHMSKVNQPPIGLHRLSKYMSKKEGKTAAIHTDITICMQQNVVKIATRKSDCIVTRKGADVFIILFLASGCYAIISEDRRMPYIILK